MKKYIITALITEIITIIATIDITLSYTRKELNKAKGMFDTCKQEIDNRDVKIGKLEQDKIELRFELDSCIEWCK